MKSYLLRKESDIQLMRGLIERLPYESTAVDFEETMLLASVRATTRLWQHNGKLVGFAFVDDYNNLRFEVAPESRSTQLEDEIIAWGVTCVHKRNAKTGANHTLDAAFSRDNAWQIALLERAGFVQASQRTLSYARSLDEPIVPHPLPPGFELRAVAGEVEIESLVALHRAAFGTENMTVAQRLAIMQAPGYEPELDLAAVTSEGELAAFCICSIETDNDAGKVGFTDPIGTHPLYQQRGLGKAIVTVGLHLLKARGASVVKLGTSSANWSMQRLAESLGFTCISEKLWFSKEVA
jgi:mycothiol synthase